MKHLFDKLKKRKSIDRPEPIKIDNSGVKLDFDADENSKHVFVAVDKSLADILKYDLQKAKCKTLPDVPPIGQPSGYDDITYGEFLQKQKRIRKSIDGGCA